MPKKFSQLEKAYNAITRQVACGDKPNGQKVRLHVHISTGDFYLQNGNTLSYEVGDKNLRQAILAYNELVKEEHQYI